MGGSRAGTRCSWGLRQTPALPSGGLWPGDPLNLGLQFPLDLPRGVTVTSRDRGTCSGWRLQTSQQEAGFWAEVPRAQPLHAAGALSLRPPCTPRPGPGRCPHCGRGSEGSRGPPAAGGRGRAAGAGRARGSGWLWAASGWGLGQPSFSLAGSVATSALSPLAEQAPRHRHGVTTRSAAHFAARGASVHLCRSPRGQGLKGARCRGLPAPRAAGSEQEAASHRASALLRLHGAAAGRGGPAFESHLPPAGSLWRTWLIPLKTCKYIMVCVECTAWVSAG